MKLRRFGAILVALMFFTCPIAFANELVNTDPASGSVISVSPSAVTITTSLPLMADGNSVEVTDPTGVRVDDGTLAIADYEVIVGLTPLEIGGYYTVTYLLLAENDIPLQGSYRFNFMAPTVISSESPTPVASESTTAGQPSASSSTGTDALVIFLLILSFAILVGLGMYARKIFNDR